MLLKRTSTLVIGLEHDVGNERFDEGWAGLWLLVAYLQQFRERERVPRNHVLSSHFVGDECRGACWRGRCPVNNPPFVWTAAGESEDVALELTGRANCAEKSRNVSEGGRAPSLFPTGESSRCNADPAREFAESEVCFDARIAEGRA
nr:hypothetical protein [Amycolatopsis dendrobii]